MFQNVYLLGLLHGPVSINYRWITELRAAFEHPFHMF